MNELLEENRMLRERIAVLQEHIHAGINCGFFCALPECAKFLTREDHDKDSTSTPRSQAVAGSSCSTGDQPCQRPEMGGSGGAPGGKVAAV